MAREALLVVLALTLALPLAAAGPIADSGLATREEWCADASSYEVVSEEDGVTHEQWSSGVSCRSSDGLGAGSDGLARAEVREGQERRSTLDGSLRYGGGIVEYEEVDRTEDTGGTYAEAEALSLVAVDARDVCGQEGTSAYSSELVSSNGTDVWQSGWTWDGRWGCWTDASTAVAGADASVMALHHGCANRQRTDGTHHQHADSSDLYEDASEGTEMCGRGVEARAAGESVQLAHGRSCAGEGSHSSWSTSSGTGYASASEQRCVQGVTLRGPADTRVAAGEGSTTRYTCVPEGCSAETDDDGEGVWVDVAGASGSAPAPVGPIAWLP